MSVIRKMEAGKKRANVCSSLGLVSANVSTIMANAEKNKIFRKKYYKSVCIKYKLH
jgi:hypothetical protein